MKTLASIYLQKAWNESVDNGTMEEVRKAIKELQTQPDQHDAFWVGIVHTEETVLEVSKDRSMVVVFDGDEMNALEKRAKSWEEVERIYGLFLLGDMEPVFLWFEEKK